MVALFLLSENSHLNQKDLKERAASLKKPRPGFVIDLSVNSRRITIAYILILNPQILADPYMIMGDAAMAEKISNGVFIGTCIGAFIGTILCALYAKVPFAQAPGMGLNAFFAYTVVLGIGLFITIIGLKNAGLVVGNQATLVSMVDFSQWRSEDGNVTLICGALVALVGLIVIGVLHSRNVKGSILYGIAAATIVGIPLGVTKLSAFDMNIGAKFHDFAEVSFLKMDFGGMFSGKNPVDTILTVVILVISFSLVNMFDSIGTLMGAAKQSGMMDENGEIIHMKEALMSDAISTAAGAMVGTSTVTTVVESSAGIAAGGRTGMTSLVAGQFFLGSVEIKNQNKNCSGLKSDRRGSNPRSRPWQGRALPTTPLSHVPFFSLRCFPHRQNI